MKIKINRDLLEEKIKETLKRAEGWYSQGGSGECQLYGKYDKEGNVYEFFIADFCGHSSWVEGDNIICLFVQRWFNWSDGEDLGEWLKNELADDEKTRESFIKWLKENDYYVEYWDNERANDDYNIRLHWDKFQYEFDEKKWEEYMEKWREIWFDVEGHEIVMDELHAIAEDEKFVLV